MPAEVLKTALLGEWVTATRTHTDKSGVKTIIGKRYPIPNEILKEITFDFLVKEAEGCKKGYAFDLHNKRTGELFKITVERLPFPESKEEVRDGWNL